MMINPLTHVKNVRTVYDRFYQKNIKEVQVQFLDEDPAWIPYRMESKQGLHLKTEPIYHRQFLHS